MEGKQLEEFRDWWTPCASFRLFLPELLPDVDKIIYLDSDILFLSDPIDLWNNFDNFAPNQVAGLAPRIGKKMRRIPDSFEPYIKIGQGKGAYKTQINSGVFMMNLHNMRKSIFKTFDPKTEQNPLTWDRNLFFPLYHKYLRAMFGD